MSPIPSTGPPRWLKGFNARSSAAEAASDRFPLPHRGSGKGEELGLPGLQRMCGGCNLSRAAIQHTESGFRSYEFPNADAERLVFPLEVGLTMGKTIRERIEELLRETPNDPLLHYDLAMQDISAGDLAGAATRFAQLLQLAPDYVPAYMHYGLTLQRLDRLAEARTVWEQGIATARQQGDGHAAGEMEGMLAGAD